MHRLEMYSYCMFIIDYNLIFRALCVYLCNETSRVLVSVSGPLKKLKTRSYQFTVFLFLRYIYRFQINLQKLYPHYVNKTYLSEIAFPP